MNALEPSAPSDIASASFAFIRGELRARGCVFEEKLGALVERVIHSTADFEFASLLRVSATAIVAGVCSLDAGCNLVADVEMVRIGISRRRLNLLGASVHCFVAADETRAQAVISQTTRSAMGIRRAAHLNLLDGGIVVIGNAPTAVRETIRLLDEGVRPALVIAVPVGFIGTAESKSALMRNSTVPWIVTEGFKGGSPVAVAIVNALLRLAAGDDASAVD